MTTAGRRPACSLPRMGSSSTQTRSPASNSSGLGTAGSSAPLGVGVLDALGADIPTPPDDLGMLSGPQPVGLCNQLGEPNRCGRRFQPHRPPVDGDVHRLTFGEPEIFGNRLRQPNSEAVAPFGDANLHDTPPPARNIHSISARGPQMMRTGGGFRRGPASARVRPGPPAAPRRSPWA